MLQKGVWVVLIAVGVFLGIFAYEKFAEYRVEIALQEMVKKQELQNANSQKKLVAQQNEKRAEQNKKISAQLYKDTACAINNDTNSCTCIHEKTGGKISHTVAECEKRAKQITW